MIGRWQELGVASPALRGNALDDPAERPLFVWTPPSYDADPGRRYPVVYVLHAMTGRARAWFNVSPFSENVPDAVERLGLDAIVVLVDGWTALGGSQWVDSPAIGRYGTYLCEDVVGFVDSTFRTLAAPAHRGLAGHSSGGFGAMLWSLHRPDLFGGFATHAGDALFDVTLAPEFGAAAQALRNGYGGSFEAFWQDFRSGRPVFANRIDPLLQNVYATAAAFSSREDGSVELPFRVETGELVPHVWQRWLGRDPVRLGRERPAALRSMRAIWIDAGRNDEYRLDLAAAAVHEAVAAAGVEESIERYELFEGGHRGVNWRLPLSLSFLVERLAP
jgi:pimeloyl-ACP methyl ester carboxylesterase